MNRRAAAVAAAMSGIVCTALFAWLDLLAAFYIFDWAGGEFGGFGGVGRSPAAWALPAWVILTLTLVALDVWVVRSVYRRSSLD